MILSICIPTYNRARYLKELLDILIPQLDRIHSDNVELIISENCSTDETFDLCKSIARPSVRFWRNEINIGGDRNFLKCIQEAKGEYVWLIGDDDIVDQCGVDHVVDGLRSEAPALMIVGCANTEKDVYDDYRSCVLAEQQRLKSFALVHTLISTNIFRKGLFCMEFAEAKLRTQYAHMFGLMKGLQGKVVVLPGVVRTREVRAEFEKYPSFLCVKHALYLWYLAGRFELPGYRVRAVRSVCNLPLEFGSRIKFYLMKMFRFLFR